MFRSKSSSGPGLMRVNPYHIHLVGVGQCGMNLALEFEKAFKGADVSAINTNSPDFEMMEGDFWVPGKNGKGNKLLVGKDGGTGRSLDYGKSVVQESLDTIGSFLRDRFRYRYDFTILAAGLGGGSGGSLMIPTASVLKALDQRIILLASLPEERLSLPANSNAGLSLDEIQKNMGLFTNFFLVSNDYLLKKFGIKGEDYWHAVNYEVCKNLMLIMNINNIGDSSSYGVMDEKELLRVLTFGKGYADFRVYTSKIDKLLNDSNFSDTFSKNSQVFLNRTLLQTTAAYGVAILTPKSGDKAQVTQAIERIFEGVNVALGKPPFVLRGVFTTDLLSDEISVFVIASGQQPPAVISTMISKAKQSVSKLKKRLDSMNDLGINSLDLSDLNSDFLK